MSIVNSIHLMCCPVRDSDALVKVGISRADLLGVFLRGQGVGGVVVDPGSGNALCPVLRHPPRGVGLSGFI